jgi:hypothetical protein
MARYRATIVSARPAAETFGYLAEFSNCADWDPGVLSARQVGTGPVREGTRFRVVVPFLGRRLGLVYAVTSLEPDQAVTLRAASPVLRAVDRIGVATRPGGALVSYDAEVTLRGPLRLLDPLLRRGFDAIGERAARGLARALAAGR